MTASTENPTPGQKLSEWLRARNKAPTIEDFEVYERRLEETEAALAAVPVVPERPVYEIERDRHGLMYSGPLEVGECVRVVPLDGAPVVPERGQDEGEARRLYDLHVHGNGEEPPSCDCEYPNWCLFEAGFKAGCVSNRAAPTSNPAAVKVVDTTQRPSAGVARVVPARPLDDTERIRGERELAEEILASPHGLDDTEVEAIAESLATQLCQAAFVRHENREPPCVTCQWDARRYLRLALAAARSHDGQEGVGR